MLNLDAYFARIGYSGSQTPNAETLRHIHRAHLMHVPFENLSIHHQESIQLDRDWLFDKIVTRQRGGFCYEQNGLFAAILRQMGYQVTLLEARVPTTTGELGIRFDHLALVVDLESRWLVDVGFGASFVEPLRLDDPAPQLQNGSAYRVEHDGEHGIYSAQNADGTWEMQYQFDLQPRQLADFAGACRYHQTSPESHFTQKIICSLPTPTGRISLSGKRLITTENGQRHVTELADEHAIQTALYKHFGIRL